MPYQLLTQTTKPALWPALKNGMACKCPRCGQAPLFRAYLKVNDTCANCELELHHHRADDLPPYLTIMIVGHVLVGLMMHLDMGWHISPSQYLIYLLPLAIIMPLAMLPSVKGSVVAMQWAMGMHGFSQTPDPEGV